MGLVVRLFGRKKKIPKKDTPKKVNKKPKYAVDYIGFKYADPSLSSRQSDANKAYGISAEERVHMAIFGLPGSGKSSLIKLLVLQNIQRQQGFMVVDPHGSLARDVMEMIPPERAEDVIYVNPASLYKYGKTIHINPLEVHSENERYVVVMAFVNMLYNLYKDTWGPRLEVVLRNAANALVETKDHNRLNNISALITDAEQRATILADVASKNVKHFWEEIFAKQYSKDAGSSAYNKIDKIMATPTVNAMLDATKSSISMRDIMENRRMIIVDLSTGASDDIAEFLGSIFLNMLYVEAKKRLDIEGETEDLSANPFYCYVDEAHMFSNSTMSEMLRSLRKFNVKMCLATQTANAYERDFAQEITGICKTIVTGRCDFFTANILRAVMSISTEEMQRLPAHSFALFSDERGVHANAIFRSRPIPMDGQKCSDWNDIAKISSDKWGREIIMERYIPSTVLGNLLFSPLETCIIHMMYFDKRDWYREEIIMKTKQVFPDVIERAINGAIDRLTREMYVKIMYPQTDDGDEFDGMKRYVLNDRVYSTYLSRAYGSRRAGGEDHNEILFKIAELNMKRHRYCIPDLGNKGDEAPDLLIIEPAIITDDDGYLTFDPHKWSEKNRLAVEVETMAGKHMAHSVYNYTKNIERGYDVWFVCFDAADREKLETAIRDKHEKFEKCKMDVIDYKKIMSGEHQIPDTAEESFHPVKVRNIDEIIKLSKIEKDTRTKPKSTVPPEQLKAYHETRKKQAQTYRNTVGTDYTSNPKKIIEQPQKDIPKDTDEPNLSPLEWTLLENVRQGNIGYLNHKQIWKKYGQGKSLNDMKKAIGKLINLKKLRVVYYEKHQKIGSLDGTGDRKITKRAPVLEYVYKDDPKADPVKVPDTADRTETAPDTAQDTADRTETAPDTAQDTADRTETAPDTAQDTADRTETAPDTAQDTADRTETAPDTDSTIKSQSRETVQKPKTDKERNPVVSLDLKDIDSARLNMMLHDDTQAPIHDQIRAELAKRA